MPTKMYECLICYEKEDSKNVSNMKCGHFICPDCYCKLRMLNTNTCRFCFKKLGRK